MSARRKTLSIALIVFLVALAAAFAAYSYFAYSPTGYRKFAEQHKGARERVELKAVAPFQANENKEKASSEPPPLATVEPVPDDPLLALAELEALGRKLESSSPGGLIPGESLLVRPDIVPLFWMRDVASSAEFDKRLDPTEEGRRGLCRRLPTMFWDARGNSTRGKSPPGPSASFLSALTPETNKALDRAEAVLLHESDRRFSLETFPRRGDFHACNDLIHFAVLRAAYRGDFALAERLLDRALQVWTAAHAFRWPNDFGEMERIPALFVSLAEIPKFPDDALARALERLEATRIDQETLADLLAARAVRLKEGVERIVETSQTPLIKDKMTHWLFSGALERATRSALRPVLARKLELLAIAQTQGDLTALYGYRQDIDNLLNAMNLAPTAIPVLDGPDSPFDMSVANLTGPRANGAQGAASFADLCCYWDVMTPSGASPDEALIEYNLHIDFTRFVMAACRYKRIHGEWPANVDDLAPEVIAPAFLRVQDPARTDLNVTRWEILTMPPRRFPANAIPLASPGFWSDHFSGAVGNYRRKHGEYPQSIDDIRAQLIPDDAERNKDRFVDVAETRVFVCLRRAPSPGAAKPADFDNVSLEEIVRFTFKDTTIVNKDEYLKSVATYGAEEKETLRRRLIDDLIRRNEVIHVWANWLVEPPVAMDARKETE